MIVSSSSPVFSATAFLNASSRTDLALSSDAPSSNLISPFPFSPELSPAAKVSESWAEAEEFAEEVTAPKERGAEEAEGSDDFDPKEVEKEKGEKAGAAEVKEVEAFVPPNERGVEKLKEKGVGTAEGAVAVVAVLDAVDGTPKV